jgi:hypothetical protein
MAGGPGKSENLRPIRKGEVRNPTGASGPKKLKEWDIYAAEIASDVLDTKTKEPVTCTRDDLVMRTTFAIAINPTRKDCMIAQRIWYERTRGLPRQHIDLTSSDRSMSPSRKPTTAEARQEIERMLVGVGNSDPNQTAPTAEGGEVPVAEPKAIP